MGLRYNAIDANDTGPCRDIVGELEKAIRKKGLKFTYDVSSCEWEELPQRVVRGIREVVLLW